MEMVFVPLQGPDLSHLVPWHRLVLFFGPFWCVGNLCKDGQDLAAGTFHEAISLPWDLATCQGSLTPDPGPLCSQVLQNSLGPSAKPPLSVLLWLLTLPCSPPWRQSLLLKSEGWNHCSGSHGLPDFPGVSPSAALWPKSFLKARGPCPQLSEVTALP